jgi:hypothetical protein
MLESVEYKTSVTITIRGINDHIEGLIDYLKGLKKLSHLDEMYPHNGIVLHLYDVNYDDMTEEWSEDLFYNINTLAGKKLKVSVHIEKAKSYQNYSSKDPNWKPPTKEK